MIVDQNENGLGEAEGVSADGKWAFGGNYMFSAWKYNIETQEIVTMPHPNQGPFFTGSATGISEDGSVVIGYYRPFPPNPFAGEGFIWTEDTGLISITDYLVELEIDDLDITFTLPLSISPDGTKIAGLGVKNMQQVFYLINLGDTPQEGCLDAPFGMWGELTPQCMGYPEVVASIAWPGEYSVVHLTKGMEYTFSSSVNTDYITIADENGTEVYTAGTSPVTWTPDSNMTVRFYLHLDEDCNYDMEIRDRLVQCGEQIVITEPDFPCVLGDGITSSFDNGYNITEGTLHRSAQWFEVEEESRIYIHEITYDVNPEAPVSSATLNIRADNNGFPGEIIESVTMAPTEAIAYASAFGDPVYHLVFELATPIVLDEGEYWLDAKMSSTTGDFVWALATSGTSYGPPAMRSSDDGMNWESDPNGLRLVFFVAGECMIIGTDDYKKVDFTFYPNPVRNTLNINSEIEAKNISIFNMLGQEILSSKVNEGKVDLSPLATGVYVSKITFENGSVETMRIIKE